MNNNFPARNIPVPKSKLTKPVWIRAADTGLGLGECAGD